jgi:hypothetical protein
MVRYWSENLIPVGNNVLSNNFSALNGSVFSKLIKIKNIVQY